MKSSKAVQITLSLGERCLTISDFQPILIINDATKNYDLKYFRIDSVINQRIIYHENKLYLLNKYPFHFKNLSTYKKDLP